MKINNFIADAKKILEKLTEAEDNIATVFSELKEIEANYQKKRISYQKYHALNKKILGGESKDEVLSRYKNYRASLVAELKDANSKIFESIYKDKSFDKLALGRKKKKSLKKLPDINTLEIAQIELPPQPIKKTEKKIPVAAEQKAPELKPLPPKPKTLDLKAIPEPGQKIDFTQTLAAEEPISGEDYSSAGLFSKEFWLNLFKRKDRQKDVFGDTTILPSILTYEKSFSDASQVSKRDVLDPYLLEKQIKELKDILSKKKPEVYKASTLGYVANLTVRKISIYFIEQYPEFFKKVYTSVRYANLKILANTYINIVFLIGLLVTLVSFPIFTMFFAFQGGLFFVVLLKILSTVTAVCALAFWFGFYYPKMKADTRKRSINSNLPFAIDHMSSVIASGVSPATMFKLISNSREYGEISVELEKVTNYITFFGYDILTALKAVAITTPSEDFKEFIDGFISTIETGGDLKDYLSQKSSEALLNYRLERQKYVESLSTYSDIYTGVLIAAPLFFVTALSLVSVLGGTIGGMSVNTVITLGTYVAIPGLNLLFLIFLEINQPEI